MDALTKYLNWHYASMNPYLRLQHELLNAEEIDEAKILCDELDTYLLENQTICDIPFRVYRGIYGNKKITTNDLIGIQKSYLSTTMDEYFAVSSYTSPGGYLMILDVQPGVPYIVINDILNIGHYYEQEDEILFPRGVNITCTKIVERNTQKNNFLFNRFDINILYCTITI